MDVMSVMMEANLGVDCCVSRPGLIIIGSALLQRVGFLIGSLSGVHSV